MIVLFALLLVFKCFKEACGEEMIQGNVNKMTVTLICFVAEAYLNICDRNTGF